MLYGCQRMDLERLQECESIHHVRQVGSGSPTWKFVSWRLKKKITRLSASKYHHSYACSTFANPWLGGCIAKCWTSPYVLDPPFYLAHSDQPLPHCAFSRSLHFVLALVRLCQPVPSGAGRLRATVQPFALGAVLPVEPARVIFRALKPSQAGDEAEYRCRPKAMVACLQP